ncbi:hypothetical protein KVR01_007108 [Diaporthe batatas]|uniref:uncharacterized protein n=1 Tax=Diaporthe batatas TaxID=748121 RepID=UPI001D03CB3A|nr:uncharacterized protein KVR01_007108 [Diaporthe batatas]KAG8162630.1 hypothetical protein KVR01_007108 [Diaporthe batatas]
MTPRGPEGMGLFQKHVKGRDTVTGTIPAVCFDPCNNANLEAQTRGKVPSLCDRDSDFNKYLKQCNDCLDNYSDTTKINGQDYVNGSFQQYIDYCSATQPEEPTIISRPSTTIPQSWLSYYETFLPIAATNIQASGITIAESTTIYRKTTSASTLPAYFFHTSVQALVSSYIPPAVLSELAASVVSVASSLTTDPTSLVYAALEDESRPPWFSSAVPSTYIAEMKSLEESIDNLRAIPISTTSQAVSTVSESVLPSNTSSVQGATSTGLGSKAWIAGAVVGSVAGAALLLLGTILFVRRKKLAVRASKTQGGQGDSYDTGLKPELHAESVEPPRPIYEMDATNLSELAVHEMPQELDVQQESKTR